MNEEKEMTEEELAKRDLVASEKQGINWKADDMQDALKRAMAEGKFDQKGADLIYWLYCYIQAYHFGYASASAATGLSITAIHHLMHCSYGAKYDSLLAKIAAIKDVEEKRAKAKSLGFVNTKTAERIFEACDAALYGGMPAFIYGASQSGKTTALLAYKRAKDQGTVKYLRMGVRWSKRRVVRELSKVCGCFSQSDSYDTLEDSIIRSVNNRMLLIVDEFHLALETTTELAAKEIVEYFREVFDRTGVGLVICGTKVAETGLESGKNALLFDQMRRRGLVKLVLPDVPKKADVNRLAKEFGLEPPTGETYEGIKRILKRFGLGMFVKFLQKSSSVAIVEKRMLTWNDFEGVTSGYEKLSDPENKDW